MFYKNATMLDLMGIKDDYYVQWKLETIKIRNKPYDAARKGFEKFGVEEAENHTWEAFKKRRNAKIDEEKEDKLWLLQKALERYPNASLRELGKYLGWSKDTVARIKNKLEKIRCLINFPIIRRIPFSPNMFVQFPFFNV